MGEYASKGVAGAGLGTGIAGLSLGALNWLSNGGFNLFGRNNCAYDAMLSAKDAEIAKLQAEKYTDQTGIALYKELATKINGLELQMQDGFAKQCQVNSNLMASITNVQAQAQQSAALLNNITGIAVRSNMICDFNGCNTVCNTCTVQST